MPRKAETKRHPAKQSKPKPKKAKRPPSPEAVPHDDPGVADLVDFLNEANTESCVQQTPISPLGRTFWHAPHGLVRGPEEDEDAFMQRVWANSESQKRMMLRNEHNATTVQARTDAELAIESMLTPGEAFQRLQQKMREEEEDRRRAEEQQKRAAAEACARKRAPSNGEHRNGDPTPEIPPLNQEHKKILEILHKAGTTMTEEAITEGFDLRERPTEKTVRNRLNHLEELKLVNKPLGERGGRALTSEGRELLEVLKARQEG